MKFWNAPCYSQGQLNSDSGQSISSFIYEYLITSPKLINLGLFLHHLK